MAMADDLRLYEDIKTDLLANSLNQYVLIKDQQLIGVYPTFEAALADAAARNFEAGTYLIKQVLEQEPVERI